MHTHSTASAITVPESSRRNSALRLDSPRHVALVKARAFNSCQMDNPGGILSSSFPNAGNWDTVKRVGCISTEVIRPEEDVSLVPSYPFTWAFRSRRSLGVAFRICSAWKIFPMRVVPRAAGEGSRRAYSYGSVVCEVLTGLVPGTAKLERKYELPRHAMRLCSCQLEGKWRIPAAGEDGQPPPSRSYLLLAPALAMSAASLKARCTHWLVLKRSTSYTACGVNQTKQCTVSDPLMQSFPSCYATALTPCFPSNATLELHTVYH